ncbi:MAG: HD domain-containing protein [Planctomycetaceae bacterium]|nr:HD domain-containing protein [Planctomycetaceae bacterium]
MLPQLKKMLERSPMVTLAVKICFAQVVLLALGLWIREQFSATLLSAEGGDVTAMDRWLIQVIAFMWICGLQATGTCFLLYRAFQSQDEAVQFNREQGQAAARELVRTRDAVIFGFAKLSESRDPETGRHLERISMYSVKLASALRNHPKYCRQITPAFIRTIGVSSVLHDIGKVGISDSVLLKPGKLTEAERAHIKIHTTLGADCIREIERQLGNSEFLHMAKEIALSHHEWWDGNGYPNGMKGEEIPLAARIVAIADVYDALSVHRVYKEAYPHETCVEEIREGAGTHFDPTLVDVFLRIESDFRLIARRFAAESTSREKLTSTEERILATIMEGTPSLESVLNSSAD